MARMSKHAPAKVLCSLRQREAAVCRAQKMTLQETADQMGISKPRVSQLLDAWDINFKTENVELAKIYQADELEDLRLLKHDWRPRARTDINAFKEYLKLIKLESEIAGSKATVVTKTELTGKDGAALKIAHSDADMDLSNYTTEQLEAIAAIMLAAKQPDEQ